MRLRWALLIAAVLLTASAIAGVAQPHLGRSAATPATKTITVSGHGTVTTAPDRASFDFTVQPRPQPATRPLAHNAAAPAPVPEARTNPARPPPPPPPP